MVEVESPDEETDLAREVAVLAQTPAGPGLAALLADLDVPALTDSECVEVLRARYRQASHERGELFAVITEVIDRVSRGSEPPRHEHPDWQGSAEVGAAAVLAALLPKAPRMTTSALVAAIRRHAIALDPNWARRRYEKALRSRRVR